MSDIRNLGTLTGLLIILATVIYCGIYAEKAITKIYKDVWNVELKK